MIQAKALEKVAESNMLRYTFYGVGSLLLIGGVTWLGRKIVNNAIANQVEKRTLQEGSPATFAKQFKMAFENNNWPGTNLPLVRQLFRDIPTKDFFNRVVKAYQQLYRKNLLRDLSRELATSEYQEMMSILAPKPNRLLPGQRVKPVYDPYAWAKRLKAAFDLTFWGIPQTDEEAIKAVIQEIPSKKAWHEIENAYSQLYARKLMPDLEGELFYWERKEILNLLNAKPVM